MNKECEDCMDYEYCADYPELCTGFIPKNNIINMEPIESNYCFNFSAYNNDKTDDTLKVYHYEDMINEKSLKENNLPYTYAIASEDFCKHVKDYPGKFTLPAGYILCIDYPVSQIANFKLDECKSGYDLLKQIRDAYIHMYNTEKETSTVKEETCAEATNKKVNFVNRCATNGKYGIYAHCIEDLVLEGIIVSDLCASVRLIVGS